MSHEGVRGRHAWDGPAAWQEKETNARNEGVWLPTPYRGRFMLKRPKDKDKGEPLPSGTANRIQAGSKRVRQPGLEANLLETTITLMIVPGPQGLYQIVRLELNAPLARGFRTKEQARGWIGRAIRAGVLPQGAVEVEPPGSDDTEQAVKE